MGSEIERKFVLEGMPPEAAEAVPVEIEQGYLVVTGELEVRLRRAGGERHLTVKLGSGEQREEVEVELGEAAFEALWPLTEGRRLRKARSRVPLAGGLVAEVDRYGGDHAHTIGLMKQHFMKAGHGQERSIRRPINRRDDGRPVVHGRMFGIDQCCSAGG